MKILLALLFSFLPFSSAIADYPNRQVTAIVPFAAGSGTDTVARFYTSKLKDKFKENFLIENRPGAGGTIGVNSALQRPADGYTIIITPTATVTGTYFLFNKVPYQPSDIKPVVSLGTTPFVLVAHRKQNLATVNDLIKHLSNENRQNFYAVGGNAGLALGTLFLKQTNTNASRITYSGSPQALVDLRAGRVDFMFLDYSLASSLRNSNEVATLAMLSKNRIPTDPSVPTMIEQGIDMEWEALYTILVKSGTDQKIVSILEQAILEITKESETSEFFNKIGVFVNNISNADSINTHINQQIDLWRELTTDINVRSQ